MFRYDEGYGRVDVLTCAARRTSRKGSLLQNAKTVLLEVSFEIFFYL